MGKAKKTPFGSFLLGFSLIGCGAVLSAVVAGVGGAAVARSLGRSFLFLFFMIF